jgi:hypothetical protein
MVANYHGAPSAFSWLTAEKLAESAGFSAKTMALQALSVGWLLPLLLNYCPPMRLHAVAHGAGSLRAPLSLGSLVIMVSVGSFAELVFSTNWLSWFSAPTGAPIQPKHSNFTALYSEGSKAQ